MPANTPLGLPYPLPTEPVAEGAQAIRNLAESVDGRLGVISDQIVGATAVASIAFDAIPATYRHLRVVACYRQSGGARAQITGRLNGLTSNIYDGIYSGNNSGEYGGSSGFRAAYGYAANGILDLLISDYLSTAQKMLRSDWAHDWGGHTTGADGRDVGMAGHLVNLLVPITKLELFSPSTFLTGSRFTLYGSP